ncbi:MAG: DedA family protein [Lapillicoccus sp.]
MDTADAFLLGLASSPWALLVLIACCYLDALFPPVPSEAIVLGLGTLAVSGHGAHPLLAVVSVVVVAATGAFLGDRTAYAIGRRLPPGRLPLVPHHRAERLLARAREQLDRRGATLILSARYLPVGRVAVNIVAGVVGFPARRFTAYAAVASMLWATSTVLLGVGAGALLRGRPVLSVVLGIVVGLGVGLGADGVLRQRAKRGRRSTPEGGTSLEDGSRAEVPFIG